MINYILITNDAELAAFAEQCGVKRIFVDLERLGKEERQGHLDTLISSHSVEDVKAIKQRIVSADLIVRLNPLNINSQHEIDAAVAAGADFLMLPMFRKTSEVATFLSMVRERAGVIPLVETFDAAQALPEIVKLPGVSEIYIGLNDLHLDMGLDFMFELVANGLLEGFAKVVSQAEMEFGFGGIARVGEGVIPGEMVLAEHIRVGSSSVILSRTFHRRSENYDGFQSSTNLELELNKLKDCEKKLCTMDIKDLDKSHDIFRNMVEAVVVRKRNEKVV